LPICLWCGSRWKRGTHSIWISEQLQELGHEVIVANARELRAISHSDRKSDQVDAEKLARYARLDPKILRPIAHRTVAQQEALTSIRARNLDFSTTALSRDSRRRSIQRHKR
jgi:transposase